MDNQPVTEQDINFDTGAAATMKIHIDRTDKIKISYLGRKYRLYIDQFGDIGIAKIRRAL
jgi:hypothetical protein